MTPVFSLLHISARPEGWRAAHDAFMSKCDHPESVEYILCVDAGGPCFEEPESVRFILNYGRHCTTDAWNTAAKASTGKILVCVADDFFPPEHWDTLLLGVIPDIDSEFAVQVNAQDPWPWIMTHPILTRAYYERPGRGGNRPGDLFYHEYISMGNDDDLTEVAQRDGVLINAHHLKFEHRHPFNQGIRLEDADAVYQNEGRKEAWEVKDRVLSRRRRNGYTDGPDTVKKLVVITPGSTFSSEWLAEWDQLYHHLWGKFSFERIYSQSNNIYQVRAQATVAALHHGVPDYVLWIDSDNPPTVAAFSALIAQMQASERNTDKDLPPIDIIGAWYRYKGPNAERSYVAAGRSFELDDSQLTEQEVLEAREANVLIQDLAFIGFGMLLMRGSVLAELGPLGFAPQSVTNERGFLTDDVSWCFRAKRAGHLIFLHPGAFVDHLKLNPVERVRSKTVSILHQKQGKQLEEVAV